MSTPEHALLLVQQKVISSIAEKKQQQDHRIPLDVCVFCREPEYYKGDRYNCDLCHRSACQSCWRRSTDFLRQCSDCWVVCCKACSDLSKWPECQNCFTEACPTHNGACITKLFTGNACKECKAKFCRNCETDCLQNSICWGCRTLQEGNTQ